MKVIGVAGQMQNGKDTIADYLAEKIRWGRFAFATGLKKVYCDAFGVDLEFIEKWKTNPEPPPGFDMPVRQGLQFIGDGFRKVMPNIWIGKCFEELELMSRPTVLSDVRYRNEAKAIKKVNQSKDGFGLTILVWRPGFENDDPNGSETQLKPYIEWCRDTGLEGTIQLWDIEGHPEGLKNIDVFLRNEGSVKDLYKKVEMFLIPFLKDRDLVVPF